MALPATDDFNRSDSADIGTNWTPQNGSFELASNVILPNGPASNTENAEYWNADTFADDQYAECTFVSSGNAGSGVAVRVATSTDDSWYGYYGWATASYLFKMVTGSWTQLGANAAAFSGTDVVKIDADGTTITGYINDSSERTATDSALSSGAAGVTGWGDNAGSTIDDWEGGDLGGGDLTVSVNDSVAVADTPVIDVQVEVVESEAISVNDSPAIIVAGEIGDITESETISVNDLPTVKLDVSIAVRRRRITRNLSQNLVRHFILNRHSSQARGLVWWWPTVNPITASGTWRDYSGTGNHLALGTGNGWEASPMGGAITFNDTASSALQVATSWTPPSQTSISFWMRHPGLDPGGYQRLIGTEDAYELILSTGTTVLRNQLYAASTDDLGTPFLVDDGVWRHFVCTGNLTTNALNIYVNGINVASNSFADDTPGSGTLQIGARTGASEYFSGSFADFRFYNRILHRSEVWQIYNPQTRWDLYQGLPRTIPVSQATPSLTISPSILSGWRQGVKIVG